MAQGSFAAARIAVVDDEHPNVRLMTQILRSAGYTHVAGYTDPELALARLTTDSTDLVLLDLHMPAVDGLEFLARLRAAADPTDFVPVIMLTGDLTRDALRRSLEAGANEFVTKPMATGEVLLRVRNLLSIRFSHQELRHHNAALAAELSARDRLDALQAANREHTREVIERIVARGGPAMLFQPIVALATGEVVGVEALARFGTEPRRGPDQWFADAALVGLSVELELSAIDATLAQLPELDPGYLVAVNVSADTMLTDPFRELTARLPLERMSFEVTEHEPVADYDALLRVTRELRARGSRLAVDDAGSGYASLRHILRLEPDVIKLDITLTRGIDRDPVQRALAASLATFAADVGAAITAEGIETASELAALRELGIDYGQGFYLARPAQAGARPTVPVFATD